ncbi:MAG: outer membrane beta-barrel protein [Azoarcus sp.]|nr:outer membrane beta-barrel protein [Azoarcus sp.]
MYLRVAAVAIAALFVPSLAIAHEPGEAVLRVGIAHVSQDASKDTRAKARRYRYSSNFQGITPRLNFKATSVQLPTSPLGLNSLTKPHFNTNNIPGNVSYTSSAVNAQLFFFDKDSRFQPYVGLGLNYTYTSFVDNRQADPEHDSNILKLDDSLGMSAQVGADFSITESFFLNAAVWRVESVSRGLSSHVDNAARTRNDTDFDSWVYFLGFGYRF